MFDLNTNSECYFCENFSQMEDEEKCYIYGCPNYGISRCDDFIGTKKGDVFYREGNLCASEYTLIGDKGILKLKFELLMTAVAFHEIETEHINIPKSYLGQTWLLEFQPTYGRDGNIINLVNRVFIPFEKKRCKNDKWY